MRDTFLFDLDGTLLPMDFDKFMTLYFYNLGVHFHKKIDPKILAKNVMEATNVMVQINNGQSNEEKFMSHFATLIDGDINQYIEMFNSFYDTLFENVKESTYQSTEMIESVQILIDKGYKVVIATNPLFPLKANLHRIRWAGFEVNMFDYISSFEENKYCKPHIDYYQEVLAAINKSPKECYMIGNDVSDDLPAGKLGIETYLITDCVLNKNNEIIAADHIGNYLNFKDFVLSLDDLNTTN